MHNAIQGFSVLGGLRRRQSACVVADLWDVECSPGAGGYYVSEDPRLFVLLETRGRRERGLAFSGKQHMPPSNRGREGISYIPAGMELWARLDGMSQLRHLDLHFSRDALERRLGEDLDADTLQEPRLMNSDPGLMALARLISAECDSAEPLHGLYLDGLAIALLTAVLQLAPMPTPRRTALAGWQLRRSLDFIRANCLRTIRLEELAQLTGLSASYFSHAFKAATGLPPHQWQMQARIDRAKALMLAEAQMPLPAVATELGFADQAHFTRVFRKTTGTTPARWRKSGAR